jgi:predicted transcriptional regulator
MLKLMAKKAVSFRIDNSIVRALDKVVKETGLTKTEIMEQILFEVLGVPVARPDEVLRDYLASRKADHPPGSTAGPPGKRGTRRAG